MQFVISTFIIRIVLVLSIEIVLVTSIFMQYSLAVPNLHQYFSAYNKFVLVISIFGPILLFIISIVVLTRPECIITAWDQ